MGRPGARGRCRRRNRPAPGYDLGVLPPSDAPLPAALASHPSADPEEHVRQIHDADCTAQHLGITVSGVGRGRATATLRVTPEMLQAHGTCHGGYLFLLADTAFAYACNAGGPPTVASGADVEFLAPAYEGDLLVAEATERVRRGRSGIFDVTVRRGDDVLVEFRGRSRELRAARTEPQAPAACDAQCEEVASGHRWRESEDVSAERVQAFLDDSRSGLQVIHTDADTSTVARAAAALGIAPAQIAKTLALRAGERTLLLVTGGDARLDNAKFRARFSAKPRMLSAEEAEALTGQPVGGVAPFGHPGPVDVYCDESLREFDVVYPAGGSPTSAVRVAPEQLAALAGAAWVDVTR